MEKYQKILPLGLFCLIVGKLLITGASWEGAAVALVAGLLAGAYEFKNHSAQVKALETRIETAIDVINAQGKAIEEMRISLSSVRLGQQAKNLSSQPAKQELQRIF